MAYGGCYGISFGGAAAAVAIEPVDHIGCCSNNSDGEWNHYGRSKITVHISQCLFTAVVSLAAKVYCNFTLQFELLAQGTAPRICCIRFLRLIIPLLVA